MKHPYLVIMAAGLGSRYGGLKQIDPVGPSGEIVMDYSIYDAIEAGFERVIFVIRPETEEAFRERMRDTVEKKVETVYAYQTIDSLPEGFQPPAERTKPWGTGHAVLCARDHVDRPFAVINADDFYGSESFRQLHDYLVSACDEADFCDLCMVGFELDKTLTEHGHVSRGVCTANDDDTLRSIREYTKIQRFGTAIRYTEDGGESWHDIDGSSIVSMNMWGFTRSFMDELQRGFKGFLERSGQELKTEFFIPTVVDDMVQDARARVRILPTAERWFGVTYREDRAMVREAIRGLIEKGAYPQNLWE